MSSNDDLRSPEPEIQPLDFYLRDRANQDSPSERSTRSGPSSSSVPTNLFARRSDSAVARSTLSQDTVMPLLSEQRSRSQDETAQQSVSHAVINSSNHVKAPQAVVDSIAKNVLSAKTTDSHIRIANLITQLTNVKLYSMVHGLRSTTHQAHNQQDHASPRLRSDSRG